jgi:hypothetical protein
MFATRAWSEMSMEALIIQGRRNPPMKAFAASLVLAIALAVGLASAASTVQAQVNPYDDQQQLPHADIRTS